MMNLPVEEQAFYSRLWSNGEWAGAAPNEDEVLRAKAIIPFVKQSAAAALRPFRILDLGCGRGWLTSILAGYGEVVGVDPVADAIATARHLFPGVRFSVARHTELLQAFGARAFDLVVASEVIEHVPQEQQGEWLSSIRAVLGPNGKLVLTTPRGELYRAWKARGIAGQPVENWLAEDQLIALLSVAGMKAVKTGRIWVPDHAYGWQGALLNVLPRRWRERESSLQFLKHETSIYQMVIAEVSGGT